MKIGLVRRGYSATGGAENYLLRLADALEAAGHEPVLFASPRWAGGRWPAHRRLVILNMGGPRAFADRLAQLADTYCDRLFSLERVRRCDCYRAGDGVHRAWLERRARVEPPWRVRLRAWNPKHRQILALEQSLYAQGGARTIIANSRLVRDEILRCYGGPPERIHVVHNGLPAAAFQPTPPGLRERTRAAWGLADDDYAMLFAGTGWERKGLAVALAAVARLPETLRPWLFVAGRGNPRTVSETTDARRGGARAFPRPGGGHDGLLRRRRRVRGPHALRSLFQRLPGSPRRRAAGADHARQRLQRNPHPGRDGEIIATTDPDAWAVALAAWADPDRRRAARADCTATAAAFTMDANVRRTLDILLDRVGRHPKSCFRRTPALIGPPFCGTLRRRRGFAAPVVNPPHARPRLSPQRRRVHPGKLATRARPRGRRASALG